MVCPDKNVSNGASIPVEIPSKCTPHVIDHGEGTASMGIEPRAPKNIAILVANQDSHSPFLTNTLAFVELHA